jgi:hypothetical protein
MVTADPAVTEGDAVDIVSCQLCSVSDAEGHDVVDGAFGGLRIQNGVQRVEEVEACLQEEDAFTASVGCLLSSFLHQ